VYPTVCAQLGVPFPIQLQAPHVVDMHRQVWAGAIGCGPGPAGTALSATYKSADSFEFQVRPRGVCASERLWVLHPDASGCYRCYTRAALRLGPFQELSLPSLVPTLSRPMLACAYGICLSLWASVGPTKAWLEASGAAIVWPCLCAKKTFVVLRCCVHQAMG
jgi:hypothetical protein